jgi:hypothetical protein
MIFHSKKKQFNAKGIETSLLGHERLNVNELGSNSRL